MRNKLFFCAAAFWTLVIGYLCLVPSSDIPKITFIYMDKVVHFSFHFIFTSLWILYFESKNPLTKNNTPLLISFSMSVIFGVLIEISQSLFTTTRTADVFDVFANTAGAFVAVLAMSLYGTVKKQITK